MSATTTARPFQVKDRIKVTVRDVMTGKVLRTHTATVRSIKDMSDPSVDDWATLMADADEPYAMSTSGVERTTVIVHLVPDHTRTTWAKSTEIELLPQDDTTPDHGPLAAVLSDRTLAKVLSRPAHVPSLVALDQDDALARMRDAALEWHEICGDFGHTCSATWKLHRAIAGLAEVTQ